MKRLTLAAFGLILGIATIAGAVHTSRPATFGHPVPLCPPDEPLCGVNK